MLFFEGLAQILHIRVGSIVFVFPVVAVGLGFGQVIEGLLVLLFRDFLPEESPITFHFLALLGLGFGLGSGVSAAGLGVRLLGVDAGLLLGLLFFFGQDSLPPLVGVSLK